jgi:hypothetical protein
MPTLSMQKAKAMISWRFTPGSPIEAKGAPFMDFRQALWLQTPSPPSRSWYYLSMRIGLVLMLAGLFAAFQRRRPRPDGKRRLLNVEEAVRLWSGHGAVF